MDHTEKIVIAIDGPAAAGKSSTARAVAQKLGYLHIDTGAMYRAFTLKLLNLNVHLDSAVEISKIASKTHVRLVPKNDGIKVLLDGKDVTDGIRTREVTRSVSIVSSYPAVREVMVREQRRMAGGGGVVLEGRDIGTVVLPQADLKIFMIANVAERARRRKKELVLAGIDATEEDLVREIESRDAQDSARTSSPLKKAPDAVELDTSNLTINQQVEYIVQRAKELIRKHKKH